MFFSGLDISHFLASLALALIASVEGANLPFFESQPCLTKCRSTGLPWNSFLSSSGLEPVSQGRSLVSCSSGSPITFKPLVLMSCSKESSAVLIVRLSGDATTRSTSRWYGKSVWRWWHCSSPNGVSRGSWMPWFATERLWKPWAWRTQWMVGGMLVAVGKAVSGIDGCFCFGFSEDGLAGCVLGRRYKPVHCEKNLKTEARIAKFPHVT